MKKLLMVAMTVITSLSLNAASYVWGFTGDLTGEIYQPGTSDYLENGTAFLFLGTVTASASAFDTSAATLVTTGGFDGTYYAFGNVDTDNPSSSDLVSTASGQEYTMILVDQSGLTSLDGYEGDYYMATGTSSVRAVPGATVTYYAEFYENSVISGTDWSTMAATPTPPGPPDPAQTSAAA